ncbi:MAG: ATP-binding protein [Coriobacteriales bacterium]
MLPARCAVVALVSGGADSTALLRLLSGGGLGDLEGRLFVLHVNHLLRGTAADEDADAVRALCAEQKVPCSVVRYDVAGFAEAEGLNLEDAGRRVRYALAESELDARCADLGLPGDDGRIATGHTIDDQLETFLMRLVTGSGPG